MRPKKCRKISFDPETTVFKPAGIPMRLIDSVELEPDESEAIKLADYENLYHEEAGKRMGISRQSFSRILNVAHNKVADAIINGKCLVLKRQESLSPEEDRLQGDS